MMVDGEDQDDNDDDDDTDDDVDTTLMKLVMMVFLLLAGCLRVPAGQTTCGLAGSQPEAADP